MKSSIIKNKLFSILFLVFLLVLWKVLSAILPSIILPSPTAVFSVVVKLFVSGEVFEPFKITMLRFILGMGLSFVFASVLGVCMGINKKIEAFFMPMINIIQAIPPISWLLLAIVWFGLNGKPTILIVFLSTVSIILINLLEGIRNVDKLLLDMGKCFKLNKAQIILHIIIPSLTSYIESGVNIAIGVGLKLVIMGEVISSSNGVGGEINNARLNLETDKILAWTVAIVMFYYLMQKLVEIIFRRRRVLNDS